MTPPEPSPSSCCPAPPDHRYCCTCRTPPGSCRLGCATASCSTTVRWRPNSTTSRTPTRPSWPRGRPASVPWPLALRQRPVTTGRGPRAVPRRAGGDAGRRHGCGLHPHHARGSAPPARCAAGAVARPLLPPLRPCHDRGGRRPARRRGTRRRRRRPLLSVDRAPLRTARHRPTPPVCLGTDGFHTPPELLALAEAAFSGFGGTGLDSPFSGTYVPLKHYGTDRRVGALMIEIRRDLYMPEPGGPAGPGLDPLASALAGLVDGLTGL